MININKVLSYTLVLSLMLAITMPAHNAYAFHLSLEDEERFFGLVAPQHKRITQMTDGMIANGRFFAATSQDRTYEHENHLGSAVQVENFMAYQPDYPMDAMALLMQRLFPIDMVPNQRTDRDPLHHITHIHIGHLLTFLKDEKTDTLTVGEKIHTITDMLDRELHAGFL